MQPTSLDTLTVKSFGPIVDANIKFKDLTFLVGPQASGKSVLLQLIKLLIDKSHVRRTLEQYGYVWSKDTQKTLDLYFGEGMSGIWSDGTSIKLNTQDYSRDDLIPKRGRGEIRNAAEELFYIPAQRILCVGDGRPKTFMEFDVATPYVLRQYSETLRQLLQNEMGKRESIFPISNRLKAPLRKAFNQSIFHQGKVILDEKTGQRKLRMEIEGMNVPFITWSAGQKEFMPLLLGFYWLCPPAKVSKKDDIKYVVIEEPEMGLHVQAIEAVIIQIIDLISRGYKVIVSTHSPVLLEFAWAFNILKESNASDDSFFELFDIGKNAQTRKIFEDILSTKSISTYFFERTKQGVISKDISSLDASSHETSVSEWGGLSSFSSRASELASKVLSSQSE